MSLIGDLREGSGSEEDTPGKEPEEGKGPVAVAGGTWGHGGFTFFFFQLFGFCFIFVFCWENSGHPLERLEREGVCDDEKGR